jgi:hypothetical protein
MSPKRGSTPRQTDWLTVSRNETLTLTEHRYRGVLTTLKIRDAFVSINAVTVLVWVMRLCGRCRRLSIEVESNLWGRKTLIYRWRKRLCGKLYANGFALPRYQTLDLESGASEEEWMTFPSRSPDLPPCDFFLGDHVKNKCLCLLYHWILMNNSWELPQLSRELTGTC